MQKDTAPSKELPEITDDYCTCGDTEGEHDEHGRQCRVAGCGCDEFELKEA